MAEQIKYSTRFFCPLCKKIDKKNQMLYLDESINLLRCERHLDYMKKCNCRIKDMIVFDIYPETEQEAQEMIENLEFTTEEQAKIDNEDFLEREHAYAMKEAFGEDFVQGFEFEEGA